MLRNRYKGWLITYGACLPVTGRYLATRYGVEMCAHSYGALMHMIDHRND